MEPNRTSKDVSNIVKLVQAGRFNRSDAAQSQPLESEHTDTNSSDNMTSSERRQRIIQQLLNKRKQGSNDSAILSEAEGYNTWARTLGSNFNQETETQRSATNHSPSEQFTKQSAQQPNISTSVSPPLPPALAEAWGDSREGSNQEHSQSSSRGRQQIRKQPQRSQSAGRQRSQSAGRNKQDSFMSSMNGRAFDDSQLGDARTHRILQTDAIIKQEMFKECTFKPKINSDAHRSNADDSTPFYDRAAKWQQTKEQEAIKRKASLEKLQGADWTFHPKINRNSIKSAKELRGDVGDVSTRLYKGNEEISAMKAKYVEEEHKRELEIETRQCTFQPQCVTDKTKYAYVTTKYNAPDHKPKDQMSVDATAKECTFTPKVKGVRPNMSSAKLYLESNVVDRLSKPITASHQGDVADISIDHNDRPVMDMASFMNSLHLPTAPQYSTPSSTKGYNTYNVNLTGGTNKSTAGNRSRVSGGGGGGVTLFGTRGNPSNNTNTPGATHLTAEEKELRRAQFDEFLGRQEQSLLRKGRNVKEVMQSETPHFKPELCRKSLHLAKQHSADDFLDRMEKSVIKKQDADTRRQETVVVEHTFQPKISQKSEKLRPRTAFEMSRGDMLKQESNRSNIKLRLEQEEVKTMSFKPKITSKAKTKVSTLADPQSLLDTYRSKLERTDSQRQAAIKERDEKEFAECTFAPSTRSCPSYIAKIAASMNAINNARVSGGIQIPEKPTWR